MVCSTITSPLSFRKVCLGVSVIAWLGRVDRYHGEGEREGVGNWKGLKSSAISTCLSIKQLASRGRTDCVSGMIGKGNAAYLENTELLPGLLTLQLKWARVEWSSWSSWDASYRRQELQEAREDTWKCATLGFFHAKIQLLCPHSGVFYGL